MHLLTIIANLCGLQKLRDDYADAFGDVPALHGEMAATHRKTGGVGCIGEQRPTTNKVIARPHNGCVTR